MHAILARLAESCATQGCGGRWGLTRRALVLTRTLFAGNHGLEHAKQLVVAYKKGEIREMTPELWKAKKIVDSTLHPGMKTYLARNYRSTRCALRRGMGKI